MYQRRQLFEVTLGGFEGFERDEKGVRRDREGDVWELFEGDNLAIGEERGNFGGVFDEVVDVEVEVKFLVEGFVEGFPVSVLVSKEKKEKKEKKKQKKKKKERTGYVPE
jgi:hypothetical protein